MKGFGRRPLVGRSCRERGPAFESLPRRKPRAGRGAVLVGRDLWGFEDRGQLACVAAVAGGVAGLTGAPDESGQRRRERGLAKAGNSRVRRGMIELAWGHLLHQKGSPLTEWFWKRASDARGGTRKTMIVALARKLLIVLWRLATTGETPAGLRLRPAA